MKILISAYRCDPSQGGEALRSWTWINYYLKEGFEVVCLTNQWDKQAVEKAASNIPGLQFFFLDIPKWVERTYVNILGVYFHYLVWQRMARKKAEMLHKVENFDYVHHTCYGSLQLGSGMWRLGIPFIYGPIGGGQFAPKAYKKYFYSGWKEEVSRLWISKILMMVNSNAKNALKHSHIVITENFETRDLAIQCGAKNIKMFLDAEIPMEESVEELLKIKSNNRLKVLWVGRLLYRKGLPLALEALSLLKEKLDFEFTIVGDGPAAEKLPTWLDQYGLQAKVKWLGQQSLTVVKEHYKQSDIMIFSSLRDSSGAQLFEAMSYGLPIVTLDHFGSKALLPENTCIKIPVLKPEVTVKALADAVLKYGKNEGLRKAHGANAIHYMKNEYRNNIPLLIKSLKNGETEEASLVTKSI